MVQGLLENRHPVCGGNNKDSGFWYVVVDIAVPLFMEALLWFGA